MGNVVGQRWEVYDYTKENIKAHVLRKGEMVIVGKLPGLDEKAIVQLLGDGQRSIEELYEHFIATTPNPQTVDAKLAQKQDKIAATGPENLLTAPGEPGGQPGIKPVTDLVSQEELAEESRATEAAIAAETQAREGAIQVLSALVKTIAPESVQDDIPDIVQLVTSEQQERRQENEALQALLALKAPLNNPVFTGLLKAAFSQAPALTDVLVTNTAGDVYKRPASGLSVARATTAGAADMRTAPSAQVMYETDRAAFNVFGDLLLTTHADVANTVAYMIRNPPPLPTGITISDPPAMVYGSGTIIIDDHTTDHIDGDTVDFAATVEPANALGVVIEWSASGSVASFSPLADGGFRVQASVPASFVVTATIKGTDISATKTVTVLRRPGAKE